jgi:hypothetical protein
LFPPLPPTFNRSSTVPFFFFFLFPLILERPVRQKSLKLKPCVFPHPGTNT